MNAFWLNLDKPEGISSTKAVSIARKILKCKKAGHAGTLDPLANGILPIAFGQATRLICYAQEDEKEYVFSIKWGIETTTLDREGEVLKNADKTPTEEEIISVLPAFLGSILQIPPIYSALKVNGERAYDLARQGKPVELKERQVQVKELEYLGKRSEESLFRVSCGKGLYVRSLARDIAYKLGTVGSVWYLRRTRVGKFGENTAISLEKLEKLVYAGGNFNDTLLRAEFVLDDIPAIQLDNGSSYKVAMGQKIMLPPENLSASEELVIFNKGNLLATGKVISGYFQPSLVFMNKENFLEE